ncbi:histidine kinase [Sulfuricella sp. T08]|uniref:sensor histidine kinase n=1 Tax=Sulfuricella sp. T08 TaxID=1632857 RepID=UPI0006179707|nr:ATP-binding protein [Sulfuricella sp. T08]GAO35437.1 histidine kinase [Sulfuricella sp. T08]
MNRSLQRHLSLMLGAAILLSGLIATVASFMLAYGEAKEFQDDMLRQIAVLAVKGAAEPAHPGKGDVALNDPESRILVVRLPGNPRPEWLHEHLSVGFHTLSAKGEELRVFVQHGSSGERTIVAQPTDARDEIAINSALRTLIPLLLLFPLLTLLIVRIIRREFTSVGRISCSLDAQTANRPSPIVEEGLPNEITPFVQAINRLLGRINQLMSQQQRFIADAAHELRSPLTALSMQAQNLRQANSLEAMHERVAPLQAGIERARQLTEQLLNLARIQADGSTESIVDVSVLTRELIAQHLSTAEAKDIDLGLEECDRLSLRASPESLRLILGNVLENAIKYTPAGGEVTLRVAADGGMAVIEVVDSGTGIPPAERDRVFDAFYRMPGATGTGSGLGLAIAREAATRLGGEINLKDRPDGSGLIFSYRQRLPT